MQENCPSGSEGGGAKPIASPYPYIFVRPLRGLMKKASLMNNAGY